MTDTVSLREVALVMQLGRGKPPTADALQRCGKNRARSARNARCPQFPPPEIPSRIPDEMVMTISAGDGGAVRE